MRAGGVWLGWWSTWGAHVVRALLALVAVICVAGVAPALAQAAGTGTISGRVTDAAGDPIAYTEVCADLADVVYSAGRCPTTNEAGEYSLTGLQDGTYIVVFRGEVCLGEECKRPYVRQYWENAQTYGAARRITIASGSHVSNIDAQLTEGGRIEGVAQDSRGEGIEGIWVCALETPEVQENCAKTNSGGAYTLEGLGERPVIVKFDSGQGYADTYYRGVRTAAEATSLEVRPGETLSGIDVTMAEGGRISGTVTDAAAEPIAHTQVCAFESARAHESCALTNEAGEYSLTSLDDGSYDVEFTGRLCDMVEGFANCTRHPYLRAYWPDTPSVQDPRAVTVANGSAVSNIDAQLTLGGRIEGVVQNSKGERLEGLSVCAFGHGANANGGQCTDTNADGTYAIEGIPREPVTVSARGRVCPTKSCSATYIETYYPGVVLTEDGAAQLEVAPGETLTGIDFTMTLGGGVAGMVTNKGLGIEGAQVCAMQVDTEDGVCTTTSAGGTYSIAGLPSGQYELEFWIPICGSREDTKRGCTDFLYYPGSATRQAAELVTVTAPETTSGINLELEPLLPVAVAAPTVAGVPAAGQELVCSTGEWVDGADSFLFEWLRDGALIPGQAGSTYLVQTADEGHEVACRVTAGNSSGSTRAMSNSIQIPLASAASGPGSPGGDTSPDQPAGSIGSTGPNTAGNGDGGSTGRPNETRSFGNTTRGKAAAATVGRVRGRRATVQLRCAGAGPCKGRLDLLEHATGHSSGSHGKPHAGTVKIGSAGFFLAKGAKRTVRVRLSANALRAVRAAGSHGMAVQVGGVDVRRRRVILKATGKPARSRQASEH